MYVDIKQDEPLTVEAEAASPVKHGERAWIGIPVEATCLFAGNGTYVERTAFH